MDIAKELIDLERRCLEVAERVEHVSYPVDSGRLQFVAIERIEMAAHQLHRAWIAVQCAFDLPDEEKPHE